MDNIINCGTNLGNRVQNKIHKDLRNILIGCALGFGLTFLTGCPGRTVQIRDEFNDYGGCAVENLNKRLNKANESQHGGPSIRVEPYEYQDSRGIMVNVDVVRAYQNIFEEH